MLTYDYITDFHETAKVTILGTTHGLGPTAIGIDVKVLRRDGMLIPYSFPWWANPPDPTTGDITVHLFTNRHSGVVFLTRQPPSA